MLPNLSTFSVVHSILQLLSLRIQNCQFGCHFNGFHQLFVKFNPCSNLNLLNYQKTESLFILAIDTKSFFWIFNYWKIVSIKKLLKYYLLKEQKIFFSFFFFFPERLFIWTIFELEYRLTTPRTKARYEFRQIPGTFHQSHALEH